MVPLRTTSHETWPAIDAVARWGIIVLVMPTIMHGFIFGLQEESDPRLVPTLVAIGIGFGASLLSIAMQHALVGHSCGSLASIAGTATCITVAVLAILDDYPFKSPSCFAIVLPATMLALTRVMALESRAMRNTAWTIIVIISLGGLGIWMQYENYLVWPRAVLLPMLLVAIIVIIITRLLSFVRSGHSDGIVPVRAPKNLPGEKPAGMLAFVALNLGISVGLSMCIAKLTSENVGFEPLTGLSKIFFK
jgi:hypothetical protein